MSQHALFSLGEQISNTFNKGLLSQEHYFLAEIELKRKKEMENSKNNVLEGTFSVSLQLSMCNDIKIYKGKNLFECKHSCFLIDTSVLM